MSIDESALAHIMNVLTDLYADAELACIREYLTNALDSHIEAGQTRPVEITTPTALRPLLTIRDYGTGLDADAIRDIYSRYGASTKRGTNDAVGMLGLGCKSALAYVDQFTLAGIKDGERMLVSISRDETGAGTMTVLEAGPTDEPDGVEVCIPTDDTYALERKAADFLSYWEPGLALLNGQPSAPLEGYEVGDYIIADRDKSYAAPGRHDGRPLTIVMGNVSYPPPDDFESEIVDSLPEAKRLVVRVPIGAVHFTPSREGLQDSARTREAIHAALADFRDLVTDAVTDAVTNAPDRPRAAKALIEARAAFGKKNVPELDWEGEEIPVVLSAEDLQPVPTGDGKTKPASLWAAKIVRGYSGGSSARTPAGQITLDAAGENPWILGYSNAKWSATQRRKLDRYMEHHGLLEEPTKATYFITDATGVPRPEWIDGAVLAVKWQDVREWKDPDKASAASGGGGGGSVKYAGTYPTYSPAAGYRTEHFPANDLPKSGRKLYYIVGAKRSSLAREVADILSDDAYVVCLTNARAAKFKRLFPHARDGYAAARKAAQGWYKSLSDDSRLAIALGPEMHSMYIGPLGLPAAKVDDPELSKLCAIRTLWETGTLKERWVARESFITVPDDAKPDIDMDEICSRYPLIEAASRSTIEGNAEHALLYVNAVYAANKGGK
jgi:hypothetical protein